MIRIDKTKITDYLSNVKQRQADANLLDSPAILFTNPSKKIFGNIFLFERFGQVDANSYRISSQITDHYMEDNVARQDHWSIAPDIYTLSGFIGEIIYQPPKQWQTAIETKAKDYLGGLGALSPVFDNYTQSALNVVQALENSFRRYEQIAKNIYNNINGQHINRTNQQYVAQILKACQVNRQLLAIWTPYGTFESMAIQNVSLSQPNTKYKSRLEIELKEWRNISTETRETTKEEKQAYLTRVQKMEVQDSGTAATNEGKISTLKRLGNKASEYIGNLITGQ